MQLVRLVTVLVVTALGYPAGAIPTAMFVWPVGSLLGWGIVRMFTKDDALVFQITTLILYAILGLAMLAHAFGTREDGPDDGQITGLRLGLSCLWLPILIFDGTEAIDQIRNGVSDVAAIIFRGILCGMIYGFGLVTIHIVKYLSWKKKDREEKGNSLQDHT